MLSQEQILREQLNHKLACQLQRQMRGQIPLLSEEADNQLWWLLAQPLWNGLSRNLREEYSGEKPSNGAIGHTHYFLSTI